MESSRWSWARWRAFTLGFLGMLAAVLILTLLVGVWVIWVRAYHGQQAFEILDAIQKQQAAQAQHKLGG